MCYVIPFTLPCCRRTYVSVTKMKDCPADWPKTKCPKELCFQIGSQPDDRDEGTCWRCRAAESSVPHEDRERLRPGIDSAGIEKFIVPPEERRRDMEAEGFCWFCGHGSECKSCEMLIGARREKMLGKNLIVGGVEKESTLIPVKRQKIKQWQRAPSAAVPSRTRVKTRSQTRVGPAKPVATPAQQSSGRWSAGAHVPFISASLPSLAPCWSHTPTPFVGLAGIVNSPLLVTTEASSPSPRASKQEPDYAGYDEKSQMFGPPPQHYYQYQQQASLPHSQTEQYYPPFQALSQTTDRRLFKQSTCNTALSFIQPQEEQIGCSQLIDPRLLNDSHYSKYPLPSSPASEAKTQQEQDTTTNYTRDKLSSSHLEKFPGVV